MQSATSSPNTCRTGLKPKVLVRTYKRRIVYDATKRSAQIAKANYRETHHRTLVLGAAWLHIWQPLFRVVALLILLADRGRLRVPAVFLVGLIAHMFLAERGPHDRLAGTWLVPR